jgi:hypothetical protein
VLLLARWHRRLSRLDRPCPWETVIAPCLTSPLMPAGRPSGNPKELSMSSSRHWQPAGPVRARWPDPPPSAVQPGLVSRLSQSPGWTGQLHRVVGQVGDPPSPFSKKSRESKGGHNSGLPVFGPPAEVGPRHSWGHRPQQCLYFRPLLQGHRALRPVPGYFSMRAGVVGPGCNLGAPREGSIELR